MGPGMFDGLGNAIALLFLIAVVSAPFAIWKFIEVCLWIWHHVSITIG